MNRQNPRPSGDVPQNLSSLDHIKTLQGDQTQSDHFPIDWDWSHRHRQVHGGPSSDDLRWFPTTKFHLHR